jgi:hypothetical protein
MNINGIFDAFMKFSEYSGLRNQAARKQEQINSVMQRRCGNCDHWMKTSCKPEKVHKQFKSSGSIACGAFQRDPMSLKLEAEFRGELDQINGKLADFVKSTSC